MAVDVSSYSAAIERLFEKTGGRIEPGLGRTRALLTALGNPHEHFKVFHVAGTNGKGSTVATLDSLLTASGRRVGRYTSPHLVDFRERILVAGAQIPEDATVRLIRQIDPIAESIRATFFEITTALAFAYLAESGVDVAVIETGLGGAFDSTNVVDPMVATVTNIGMDHTEFLGDTLELIANEKAGIFKQARPAVVGEREPKMAKFLAECARERGATPISLVSSDWRATHVSLAGGVTSFTAETPLGRMHLATPLLGEHQAHNALTAVASLHAAGSHYWLAETDIRRALLSVSLPGRFQRFGGWVFDVAHNPDGARVLAKTLESLDLPRPVTVVLGVLKDKDWRGIMDILAPIVDQFVITLPPSAPPERSWDPGLAADVARARGVSVVTPADFESALEYAATRSGTRLVTGSFHTVGDAMQRLGVDPLGRNDALNCLL